jgi:hypothetical protein
MSDGFSEPRELYLVNKVDNELCYIVSPVRLFKSLRGRDDEAGQAVLLQMLVFWDLKVALGSDFTLLQPSPRLAFKINFLPCQSPIVMQRDIKRHGHACPH